MNNFYEENYQHYFNSTVDLDPSVFLEPFIRLLKPQETILDIGCGSGRDLRWFARMGFQPTGFEQSPSLARLAREHANCPVIEGDFHSYNFSQLQFSALAFVGSLVHLPKEDVPAILQSTCQALAPNGVILITMKEGKGTSSVADGRIFTLWLREEIEKIFAENNFRILDFSRQISKLRPEDMWLGYVLKLNNQKLKQREN